MIAGKGSRQEKCHENWNRVFKKSKTKTKVKQKNKED